MFLISSLSLRAPGDVLPRRLDQAIAKQVRFAQHKHNDRQSSAAYAVDYILARMPSLITGNHREIVVETTLDGELQKFSTRKIRKVLTGKARALRANQAALVLMDVDGAVRAMVGGRSHSESQFNRAVKARRQPGSAFKPFVYLAALESGMTPDSTNYDLPVKVAGWSPRNGSGNYEGAVTLRYALAKSINTVAVRLNLDLGPDRVAATAARLGIKSSLRQEPSLALGTSEVNLFELTNAYATFANGGNAVQPFMVRRVRTNTGRVLYATANSEPEQLIAPKHVGAMNDMLNAALVTGTGRRAGLMRHPVAGKTGTSQQFRDAWFIGYSAHMTAGVWIGNDNGRTMDKVMGGSLPAEIWHAVMSKAHEAKAPIALPGTLPVSARVSSSPRRLRSVERRKIKRSVKAREALPWLSKKQNAEKRVAPSLLKAGRNSPKRRQAQVPRHRISEDFIARVLSQSDGLIQAKVDDPNATDAIAAQLETQPRNGRRQRPPGMMTLGAR